MPKFVLIYHGHPKFKSKEDGSAHMNAWRAWMQGLGDALVDPGLPVAGSRLIGPDGSVSAIDGADPLAGYTVLQADTIEAAIALARPCPHLSAGGRIEVAQALDMPM